MTIAPIEKLTGFFVPLAPCRGGWSFGGLSIAFTEQLREILRGNSVLIGQKYLTKFPQPECLLNDNVLNLLELFLLGKRQPSREILLIGAENFLPLLIPQA